jgi:hypothetical protein
MALCVGVLARLGFDPPPLRAAAGAPAFGALLLTPRNWRLGTPDGKRLLQPADGLAAKEATVHNQAPMRSEICSPLSV